MEGSRSEGDSEGKGESRRSDITEHPTKKILAANGVIVSCVYRTESTYPDIAPMAPPHSFPHRGIQWTKGGKVKRLWRSGPMHAAKAGGGTPMGRRRRRGRRPGRRPTGTRPPSRQPPGTAVGDRGGGRGGKKSGLGERKHRRYKRLM